MILALAMSSEDRLGAQELPFVGDPIGSGARGCTERFAPETPSAEARRQSIELLSSADQALVLGDLPRAAALLERATEIDPSSGDLAYKRARVLEQLGQTTGAAAEYCRAVAIGSGEEAEEAHARLEAMTMATAGGTPVSGDAVDAFERGLAAAERGAGDEALDAFGAAAGDAPGWATAQYNHGVALARQGHSREAAAALRRYLDLRPGAPDALDVSQRIGQLQSVAVRTTPSPLLTATLGVLLPGMGHFYSGRMRSGLTVLSMAAGAVAAGLLVSDVNVRCLTATPPDCGCPEGQVLSRRTGRPYLGLGVGAAVDVGVSAAVEAFFHVRSSGSAVEPTPRPVAHSPAPRLVGPGLAIDGGRVQLSLLRLRLH